jgi:integrase/recombinase XerC
VTRENYFDSGHHNPPVSAGLEQKEVRMISTARSAQLREDDLLRRGFVLMLKAEGKSPMTVRRYELSVRQYQEFAREIGFPTQVTREHVTHFLSVRGDAHAPNTARNDYMALVRFFRYLREEGEITTHPLEHVKPPKVPEKSPNPYRPEEIKAMLAACTGKSFDDLRNTAIIYTLLDTGLRASEFCSLTTSDVELDAERIKVCGKGRRERYVRIGIRAQRAIDRYCRMRKESRPELWLNRRGDPLTSSGLLQAIERICGRGGIRNPGVHRFRHTAATYMKESGIGEQDLMALMGWQSYSMAARYTRSGERERALRAHRLYSPADNLK